jgi:NAD(P)-dependent dehydrogenase (short-subunit alcohol dehydrogenase family)
VASDDRDPRPRTALVTGAGSGMGQLAVWRLAGAGWRVAAVDLDPAGLATTAARFPAQILPLAADLTDPDATRAAMAAAQAAYGTPDRVVAAAGVAHVGPLLDDDPDAVLRVVSVNYGATVRVVSAVVPAMLRRGRGEVVILGSIAGHCPQRRMGAYAASKAALIAYAEALWVENRERGLTVVCACPATVRTPMEVAFFPDPDKRARDRAIAPEVVLDAIDRALAGRRFLVLPGAVAKLVYAGRRLAPGALRSLLARPRFDLVG